MLLSSAVVEGDPVAAAGAVALHDVIDDGPGLTRNRRGKSFRYVDHSGKAVRDAATLSRIRALAIPPAWTQVWISPGAMEPIVARYLDVSRQRKHA